MSLPGTYITNTEYTHIQIQNANTAHKYKHRYKYIYTQIYIVRPTVFIVLCAKLFSSYILYLVLFFIFSVYKQKF